MRQIKFRAFDKDSKRMHYFHTDMPTEEGDWYISFDGKVYERHSDHGDFEVENIELMQFTGLLDKNGKEIYEGDVIDNRGSKCVIVFIKASFQIQWESDRAIFNRTLEEVYTPHYEIIGNIHESLLNHSAE